MAEAAGFPPHSTQGALPPPMETFDALPTRMTGMTVQDSSHAPSLPVPDGTAIGTSPVMVIFRQGDVVVLQSVTSGRTLCIYEGQVSGKGIRDSYSQFIVHIRPPGGVALQNVANTDNWLSIYEGRTLGSGTGGPYTQFHLHEIENKYVALESAFYRGQYVGISEDGELKPTAETPPLDRASLFIPFPYSTVTTTVPSGASERMDLPPPYPGTPQGGAYPSDSTISGAPLQPSAPNAPPPLPAYEPPPYAPQGLYPPRQQGPYGQPGATGSSPQPQHQGVYYQPAPATSVQPPGQRGSYNPPDVTQSSPLSQQRGMSEATGSSPAMAHPTLNVPTEPAVPFGYQIMDLFNKFNTLNFIACDDEHGQPMTVAHGLLDSKHPKLKGGGSFTSPDSEFLMAVTTGGNMALRNPHNKKALWVSHEKKLFMVEDSPTYDIANEFVIRPCSDCEPVVALESVKFPGNFVSVGKGGVATLVEQEVESLFVQFTVFVKRFKGPYSHPISSRFTGEPSVINKLKDMSVIQLYSKPTHIYLHVNTGGSVGQGTVQDDGTFLVYRDHGMGRVSLLTYFGKKRLKIGHNGQLSCTTSEKKGTDFYVKECSNGTIAFESASYPGNFIHFLKGKKKERTAVRQFSVFLLDRDHTNGVRGRKIIPKHLLN